ncbi:cobyrinate a,c-diamide synthase [Halalkalibacter urbisdiaboli]|uniref:cobyrinate a,c-diamide synthase n=1 Tax=Halalkalibacter urbisdiaboli TaxID=1960589 RepID=UPI000B44CC3B|nr:cobyrinate a,c-diamide synthase [Halalkalibacter urbisdiaboli]
MQARMVIAGTNSGVGKTTITLGLMAALLKQGHTIQGFKCGPDYIDPSYHSTLTKRKSRNLDSWMLSADWVNDIFVDASQGADFSLIEGVMGLYDGKSPLSDNGSTAEISMLLEAPVLLAVNIASMSRSAAAIVKGYQQLNPNVNIAGVMLNQAGSERHADLCKQAIEQECDIPVIGFLKKGDVPSIPSRHLGLIPALERGEHQSFFDELADVFTKQVDLEAIKQLARTAPELTYKTASFTQKPKPASVKIAVAYDSAFNFYYEENFTLLRQAGAELVFFSPLNGDGLPQCDGLYIGGGFPEEFAKELAANEQLKKDIREKLADGMPTLAECGGYMYLGEQLRNSEEGSFTMAGVIPMNVAMQKKRAALGYRDVTLLEDTFLLKKGEAIRGHEFHYSMAEYVGKQSAIYETKGLRGVKEEGFYKNQLVAGYTHLHFGSNPDVAQNWIHACQEYQQERLTSSTK